MSHGRPESIHQSSKTDALRSVHWLYAAAIVLAGSLTYWNSLSGPFILDDHVSIVGNEQIRRLWPPSSVLFPARELSVAGRPVVNVSFALNYAVAGLEVGGYHVVNIAIHILSALLLFAIVRRALVRLKVRLKPDPTYEGEGTDWAGRSANLALASSLLWLVHPLQTEAVNYVTQRTELLMGCFYLLTLYASIRAHESALVRGVRLQPDRAFERGVRLQADHTWAWQSLAVVACALGMGSKESMATAPLMVVLFDRVFVFESLKEAWRARWRLYAGLAATWILLAALIWSGPRSSSTGFSTGVSPWMYLLNQTVLIVRYLRLTVWPSSLVIDYGVPQPLMLADVMPYAVALVFLLLATAAALKYRPTLGFLGAWFFITLAPASSLLPIATWVGAERRMYLPLAALVVLFVMAGASVRTGSKKWMTGWMVAVIALSAALATRTVLRNREYISPLTLARTVLERYPHARAHTWVGEELMLDGHREEGMAQLREATGGDPRAHFGLGMALFEDGRLDEAVEQLQQFVLKEPLLLEVIPARQTLGAAYAKQGRLVQAEAEYREFLRMRPGDADAQGWLAETLFRAGKYEEAIGHYQEVLKTKPTFVDVITNLGISSMAVGRIDEGIAYFRRAADIDRSGVPDRNLARALLEKRDYREAAVHAARSVTLLPDDAVAHDQLGLALAGQGKLDDAIIEFRRSLQIDPKDEEAREHLAAALRARGGR